MKRIIFIVSRKQPELVSRLEQECRGGNVEIIVDRRSRGDRRRKSEPHPEPDRRHVARRVYPNSSGVDLIGIAVVVVP